MLSYVFATLTGDVLAMSRPANIITFIIGVALILVWVRHQEHKKRPAIVPGSISSNKIFSCIQLSAFLAWAAFNAFQLGMTLFFQDLQHLLALQTVIRFLPEPILSVAISTVTGLLVHRTRGG